MPPSRENNRDNCGIHIRVAALAAAELCSAGVLRPLLLPAAKHPDKQATLTAQLDMHANLLHRRKNTLQPLSCED
jgi:hypothetical protein